MVLGNGDGVVESTQTIVQFSEHTGQGILTQNKVSKCHPVVRDAKWNEKESESVYRFDNGCGYGVLGFHSRLRCLLVDTSK